MLDLIPREIILAIVAYIPQTRDRNSLSQVSKKLHNVLIPTLYESIFISSPNEHNLARTDIDELLRIANREYFKYMKSITFTAPIATNDQFRCVHYEIMENTDEDVNERSEELLSRLYNLEGLMPQIRPLFQGLHDNQLRSFHWHLGTCVPQDLLGPGGYLRTRQCKIEDLSLLTSDPCILTHYDWEWQMSLTQFKSLKTFSWSGGLSRDDFDELRDMFRSQASKLEVLKIDLLDWWDAQWNWCRLDPYLQLWIRENNFFAERVLEIVPGVKNVLFPSLKSLTLSSVALQYASLDMTHAFNFSNLNSLNLRACPYTDSLLQKVVESGEPINLQSLELVIQPQSLEDSHQEENESWISLFVNSFEGLRNLYLFILKGKRVATKHLFWPSIFHHRKMLKKLVYHEQIYEGYIQLDCNVSIEDKNILDLFMQMNLECLGFCHSPTPPTDRTLSHLTLSQRRTIKFLHLRTTGLGSELEHPIISEIEMIPFVIPLLVGLSVHSPTSSSLHSAISLTALNSNNFCPRKRFFIDILFQELRTIVTFLSRIQAL